MFSGSATSSVPSSSSCSSSSRLKPLHARPHPRAVARAYRLTPVSGGAATTVETPTFLVGSSRAAGLKLQGANIAPEHAELAQKGRQVFLKALQGESVFDRTFTFIDGDEARPNVRYVLASGARVAFGEEQDASAFLVEFDEPSGANPMVEMLMQGMAASAGPAVKEALQDK